MSKQKMLTICSNSTDYQIRIVYFQDYLSVNDFVYFCYKMTAKNLRNISVLPVFMINPYWFTSSKPQGHYELINDRMDEMGKNLQTTFVNAFSFMKRVLLLNFIFLPRRPINDKSTLIRAMAWRQTRDKASPDTVKPQISDTYIRHKTSTGFN